MGSIASDNIGNPEPKRPPVSNVKLTGEILAGVAAASVVSFFSWEFLKSAYADNCMGGFSVIAWFMFVICPQILPIVSAITVYPIGSAGGKTGSFLLTLAYSILGGIVAIPIGFISLAQFQSPAAFVVSVALTPALGATLGFNLSRRYKTPPAKAQKPPLNVARIAAQFLAGAAAAFAPVWLSFQIAPFLIFIAPVLGGAILVYVVGKIGNQTGSFGAAFAGSILAALIGVPIGFISLYLRLLFFFALPFVVSLGAVIGFNLTRRYKSPPPA